MENKIAILVSESAGGKDTILNMLVDRYGWHKAVSYTTRPMRENEINGKDYHFLNSNKQFEDLMNSNQLFEKTEYLTEKGLWLYGLGNDSFVDDNINITILNPHGIDQLLQNESIKDRLELFYIKADFKTRFFRYLNRDNIESHHKVELVDRILRDESDFKDFEKNYHPHVIINNDDSDMEFILNIIKNIMEENN